MDFEQLRDLHEKKKSVTSIPVREPVVSMGVFSREQLYSVRHAALVFGLFAVVSMTWVVATGICLRASALHLQKNIAVKKLPVIGQLGARGVVVACSVSILLVTSNAIVSCMWNVAHGGGFNIEDESSSFNNVGVWSPAWWTRVIPYAVFFMEWFGIVMGYAYMWLGSSTMKEEFVVVAVMMYFLASFLDIVSVLDAPEEYHLVALWLNYLVFGQGLVLSVAFWYPYIRREVLKVKKEMEGSGVGILQKRREDIKDLRERFYAVPNAANSKPKRA